MEKPEDVKTILEKKDRKYAGPTAPACGLYLNKVEYWQKTIKMKGVMICKKSLFWKK